jgi:hypothetical protein
MLHASSNRPSNSAIVAKSPSLFEDVLRWPDSAINDCVANKLGTQVVRHDVVLLRLLGRLVNGFRHSVLIQNGAIGVHHKLGCGGGNSGVFGANPVAQNSLPTVALLMRGDADIADGRREFNKRMRLVVLQKGACLAIGTEVDVVAYGTLVTDSADVGRVTLACRAEWSITANALVSRGGPHEVIGLQRLVHWNEAMARVDEVCIGSTVVAKVPVRAIEALVADAANELVTGITNGLVPLVATSRHLRTNQVRNARASHSRRKVMGWMMSMDLRGEAV